MLQAGKGEPGADLDPRGSSGYNSEFPNLHGNRGLGILSLLFLASATLFRARTFSNGVYPKPQDDFIHGPAVTELPVFMG